MSRRQAHLVTLIGCMISLVSFCFLPYLVVPFSSFSFTGLQLVILEDRIPLPNYVVIVGYPLELQNIPFIWAQLLLVHSQERSSGIWYTRRHETTHLCAPTE